MIRTGTQSHTELRYFFPRTLFKMAMKMAPDERKAPKPERSYKIPNETVWLVYLLNDLGITNKAISRHLDIPLNTVYGFVEGRNRRDLLTRYEMNKGLPSAPLHVS